MKTIDYAGWMLSLAMGCSVFLGIIKKRLKKINMSKPTEEAFAEALRERFKAAVRGGSCPVATIIAV